MNPAAQQSTLAALALALVGCMEHDAPSVNGLPDRSSALTEELRIDGHAEDLVRIGAVAVGDDGKIAITQPQDGLVRLYSAEGEPIGAFGREGEGPGEFQNPLWIAWDDDSLKVYDGRLRRLTTLTPALELAGTSPMPPPLIGADREFSAAYPRGLRQDGSALAGLSSGDDSYLGVLGQDGVVKRILARMPPAENAGVTFGGGAWARLPFANEPQYGISPRGDRIAIAMATLEGSDAGTFLLTVVEADGDSLVHRRYPFEGDPIPAAAADSIISARVARLPSTEAVAAVRRATHVPPFYPPLSAVLVGSDSSIWIEMRSRPEGRPYYVVAADGEPVGTVLAPPRSRIAAAALDRIHVLEADELDVQSLVRYSVAWQARR